jgi:hypothetical protein
MDHDELVRKLVAVRDAHEQELMSKPGVIGTGIGFKRVKGEYTDTLAIVVYVAEKKAVPAADEIPPVLDGYPTDVIAIGGIHLGPPAAEAAPGGVKTRPLVGGVSIGSCRLEDTGTLGMIVEKQGRHYALTNFHVVCVDNNWAPGNAVRQPGQIDKGTCPVDDIGAVESAAFGDYYLPPTVNKTLCVDAALVSVRSGMNSYVKEIGAVRFDPKDLPNVGAIVSKYGRTSGLTHGTIRDVNLNFEVPLPPPMGPVKIKDCFTIEGGTGLFALPGDSGSVVVRLQSPLLLGLYYANAENGYAIASAFGTVKDALGFEVTPTGFFGSSTYASGSVKSYATPVADDKYVYYKGDNELLMRMPIDGGAPINFGPGYKTKYQVFLYKEYVYFTGTNSYLYRVRKDGTDMKQYPGWKAASSLFVDNDFMYYRGTDDRIYRSSINDTTSTWYGNGNWKTNTAIFVSGRFIYFLGTDFYPYKADIDPSKTGSLARFGVMGRSAVFVAGNYMYFCDAGGMLSKVSIDGTSRQTPGNYQTALAVFVHNDYIYFRDRDGHPRRVRTDGKNGMQLSDKTMDSAPFVFGNALYYNDAGDVLCRTALQA